MKLMLFLNLLKINANRSSMLYSGKNDMQSYIQVLHIRNLSQFKCQLEFLKDFVIMFSNIRQYVDRIRRKQRNKEISAIKAIKREQMLRQLSQQQIFQIFYPHHIHEVNANIFDILQNNTDSLYHLLPSSNPDIEQQIISIENHTSFLRQLNRQLQYSQNNQHFELIINYIKKIAAKYNSLQIHKLSFYQIEFISLASLCQNHLTIEYKQFLLKWAKTVETLPLLIVIVAEIQLISCQSYSNIFDIIVSGLKSSNDVDKKLSINLLQKIIKYYDKGQISTIHKKYPSISQLISQTIIQKLRYKQQFIIDQWLTLLYLLNAYSQAISDLVKSIGTSFISQMMKQTTQSTLIGGLQILRIILSVQNSELYDILLIDEQLQVQKSSNWLSICLRNNIESHESFRIRKSFAYLIKIIIKNATIQQIQLLSKHYLNNRLDLIQYLCEIIDAQQDIDMRLYGIQSIDRLLFKKQKHPQQAILNIVVTLQNRNIIKRLEQLQNNQRQQVRQICGDLLQRLNEAKQQKMQDI